MVGSKKHVQREGQPSPINSGLGSFVDPNEPDELPPETAEDFLHLALKKSDLNEIARLLRDCYGRGAVKSALDKLPHRDPVDQFTHIRRHAVELYAKEHNITPSSLMVTLTGKGDRKDPERSEREKLDKARKFVTHSNDALVAAHALAVVWGNDIPKGVDPDTHLKGKNPLSEPEPEV